MTYKIAVVEDDEQSRDRISSFIMNYAKENNLEVDLSAFSDGDEILEDYKCEFQIIFLDIEMKRLDGMKTAQYIRRFDSEVIIIFVTNSNQYAVSGYTVGAMSYLVKPLSYFAFSREMERAVLAIDRKINNYIVVVIQNGVMKLDINDILFVESFKHKLIYHTNDKDYEVYGAMKDIEKKLIDKDFFRCNSGYLVNLRKVKGVKDDEVTVDNEVLKISRGRKKEFMERLLTFYSGGENRNA